MLSAQPNVEPGFPPPPGGFTWRVAGVTSFLEYLKCLSNVADNEWSSLVSVSPMFFFNELSERCPVVILPCRTAIPGELIRIYVGFSKIKPSLAFKNPSFLDQLKPLFVSLGEVILDKTAETLVILRVIPGNK